MREAIKRRDNYECQECKRKGDLTIDMKERNKNDRKKIALVVDHIKELEHHPELALDPDNLETLCVNCHNKKHGRYFTNFIMNKPKWNDERW